MLGGDTPSLALLNYWPTFPACLKTPENGVRLGGLSMNVNSLTSLAILVL